MPAHKGHKKVGGRKKGTPNKITQSVKDAMMGALNAGDGAQAFFLELKESDPKTFANIASKLIPHQIQQEINANAAVKVDKNVKIEVIKPKKDESTGDS